MTILVTGAAGLVGTHVLEALVARGERPRALVREHSRGAVLACGAEPVIGDVTDAVSWQHAARGVRAIVHAAALVAAHASFQEFTRVNVGGTRLAIEAARRAGARLIHVSSVAVYGLARPIDPGATVAEDYPFQPLAASDFYARTKRAAELLVHDQPPPAGAVAIRPNVIYGEHDRLFTRRLVATLQRRVLPQIGHGRNHLSCVYAGNVASAILAAIDTPAPGRPAFRAYNVTCDAPPRLTQREFFEAFARAIGVRPRFVPVPLRIARAGIVAWTLLRRALRPGRYAGLGSSAMTFILGENPFSIERIRSELGWAPPFDTATAIRRSVRGAGQNKSPGGARA